MILKIDCLNQKSINNEAESEEEDECHNIEQNEIIKAQMNAMDLDMNKIMASLAFSAFIKFVEPLQIFLFYLKKTNRKNNIVDHGTLSN